MMAGKVPYRPIKGLLTMIVLCLLSGCHMAILNPAGTIAYEQRELIITASVLMLAVVVPVIILTLVFARRYRASNTRAKYTPEWSHNGWLEFTCWAIPCFIVLILSIITWITSHQLDPYRPISSNKKPLVVEVISLDWKWLFIYPEQNIATVNYLQVPINTDVAFKITSDAPMNSFWIPQLGSQIMSMPGMQTQLHMKGTREGVYKGYSANLSGEGFSGMSFNIKVSSDSDFASWVKKIKHTPEKLTKVVYTELSKPSKNNPITWYSSVEKELFSQIMMKYMMPTPGETPKSD